MSSSRSESFKNKLNNPKVKKILIIGAFALGIIILCVLCSHYENFDTVNDNNEKNLSNVYNTNDYRLDDFVEGDIILESIDSDKRDYIDEGRMEGIAAHTLKCSRSCCGNGGVWPVPNELLINDPNVFGKNYVMTNLTCANGAGGSGCVCMTRPVRKLYERRGGRHDTGFI